ALQKLSNLSFSKPFTVPVVSKFHTTWFATIPPPCNLAFVAFKEVQSPSRSYTLPLILVALCLQVLVAVLSPPPLPHPAGLLELCLGSSNSNSNSNSNSSSRMHRHRVCRLQSTTLRISWLMNH